MFKVLVIDDEPDLQEIVSNIVSSSFTDVVVTTKSNGLDAFLECQKTKFNLIITDHKMPFMTGAALTVAIRTRENINQGTSILMLSGFITPDLKKELNLKNIEFMEKPLDYDLFVKRLTPYLI